MADTTVTSTRPLYGKTVKWTGSFLGYSEKSKVQQMVEAQKTVKSKTTSWQDRPEYMQMKAMQLKIMMNTYSNMGMTDAYNSAAAEAQALVVKYLKMQQGGGTGGEVDTSA